MTDRFGRDAQVTSDRRTVERHCVRSTVATDRQVGRGIERRRTNCDHLIVGTQVDRDRTARVRDAEISLLERRRRRSQSQRRTSDQVSQSDRGVSRSRQIEHNVVGRSCVHNRLKAGVVDRPEVAHTNTAIVGVRIVIRDVALSTTGDGQTVVATSSAVERDAARRNHVATSQVDFEIVVITVGTVDRQSAGQVGNRSRVNQPAIDVDLKIRAIENDPYVVINPVFRSGVGRCCRVVVVVDRCGVLIIAAIDCDLAIEVVGNVQNVKNDRPWINIFNVVMNVDRHALRVRGRSVERTERDHRVGVLVVPSPGGTFRCGAARVFVDIDCNSHVQADCSNSTARRDGQHDIDISRRVTFADIAGRWIEGDAGRVVVRDGCITRSISDRCPTGICTTVVLRTGQVDLEPFVSFNAQIVSDRDGDCRAR